MTKKAVATMNPKCRTNGIIKAGKYSDGVDCSYSAGGASGSSPLINFLRLRFWFSANSMIDRKRHQWVANN